VWRDVVPNGGTVVSMLEKRLSSREITTSDLLMCWRVILFGKVVRKSLIIQTNVSCIWEKCLLVLLCIFARVTKL